MSDDPDSGHPTPRDADDAMHSLETPKRIGSSRMPLFLTSTPNNPGSQPRVEHYFQGLDDTVDERKLSIASRIRSDRKIRVLIREERDEVEKKTEEMRILNESICGEFEAKTKELEGRLNTTVAQKDELQKEVESTKQRVTTIQFDLQAKNLDLEAAQKAISTKDALVLAKEEKLATALGEKGELKKELGSCTLKLEQKEKMFTALSKELEGFKAKSAAQISSLEKRNNQNLVNALDDRQKLQAELDEQLLKHSQEKEELLKQFISERKALDGERSDLEKRQHEEIRNLVESKEQLQSSLTVLQQQQRETEQYSDQIKQDLIATKALVSQLTNKVASLEAQLTVAKETSEAKDEQLEEVRVAFENAKTASSADFRRIESSNRTEVATLRKEILVWEQKYAHEKKYWDASEAQLRASLERANLEAKQLQKTLDEYRSELETIQTSSSEKETQLRTLQDHIEHLQTEREELSREKTSLYSKVTAHSKEELKLRNEVEGTLRERANHLGKIAELSAEVDRLSEEINRVAQVEKECQLEKANIDEEREKIGLKEAEWRKFAEEHEVVMRDFRKAQERLEQTQEGLTQCEKMVEAAEKEKERLRKKNEELSLMNDAFAQRQLDESTVAEQQRSQFFALQRKHEKLAEKLQSEVEKLENAKKRIASLEEDLTMANDRASRKEELEKINTQVTKEVEYLRAEVRSRPMAAEFREQAAQLGAKELECKEQATKVNELQIELEDLRKTSNLVESLMSEVRHKEQLLDGFKDQIESYRKDQDEKHWKMAEAHNENTALAGEFRNYQVTKEGEMAGLIAHATALENELAILKVENRTDSPRFDLEKASVWDAIPHSLRPQLPQEIEAVLRALRVDKSDANSLADSQVAVNLAPGIDKLISALDEFYRQKLFPSDNTYNILQQVVRLLYNIKSATPDTLNETVERFSSDVQQFLQSKDKKWEAKVERLQNDVDYHDRERQALKRLKNEEEIARSQAENEVRRLRLSLEGAKKSSGFVNEEKERFKMEAERLSHELSGLRRMHEELQTQSDKMKTVALNAFNDLNALETESEEAHKLEMDLRTRLRDAEADREELKRAGFDLEKELAESKISIEEQTTRRIDAERRVDEMKARLAREETTKRVNQGIMWNCISYLDRWSDYAERLKKRNSQRQRTLDRIHGTLKSMERKRGEELWRLLDMESTTTRSEQWKRDDDEDRNAAETLRENCSTMLKEQKTDMLREVLEERSAASSSRRVENKENCRPK